MTTTGGNPIADNQDSIPAGPLLMQDDQLIEKLRHQNLERIFDRHVRAEGPAACGNLALPHEIVQVPRSAAVNGKFLAARN